MDNFEDYFAKENPATNGASKSSFDKNYNKLKAGEGQGNNGFFIEITRPSDSPEHKPIVYTLVGDHAHTLWHLYTRKSGLSRAEALKRHFILSLNEHVHFFRHELDLEIFTEKVPPTGYGIYHLITPLSIRILSGEVK